MCLLVFGPKCPKGSELIQTGGCLLKPQYTTWRVLLILVSSLMPLIHIDAQQDTIVAAFYYPWYSSSPAIHWPERYLREDLVPAQPPLIGEYTSTSSTVLDQHIAWSETYGIDAWIVSWWGTDSWEENALSSSVQDALTGSDIRFTIIYESGILPSWNWDNSSTRIRFKDDMLYLAETYFNHPNYLRIDDPENPMPCSLPPRYADFQSRCYENWGWRLTEWTKHYGCGNIVD